MNSFEKHFDEALSFIDENRNLVDCHLVDFITGNLWNKCLSDSLRQQLENIKYIDQSNKESFRDFEKCSKESLELENFINRANSLSLKCSRFANVFDNTKIQTKNKNFYQNFMSEKKQHEIGYLVKFIGSLVKENNANLVIDAGAGKGYLSTSISDNYEISVLAIDSSKSHQKSAFNRQKIIKKKTHRESSLLRYSIQHIDDKTDYEKLLRSYYPEWNIKDNCILTGLHTCGQLANSMIKNFLNTNFIKSLCVVPCCYHLTEESLTGKCNLTKNARMIAQQSLERSKLRSEDSHPPSLYYRALLQVILESLGIADKRIGRGAPTRDFPTYADWALKKIGVDSEKIPRTEQLAELYQNHSDDHWKFNIFQSMRIHLGSVIEAAIVLDRVLYLCESNRCSKVALIRLFDPLISPRCYAITASK